MNLLSTIQSGITTPLPTLYTQVGQAGWSIKKVKFDPKRKCYVAEATNEHGEKLEKTGNDPATAVAAILTGALRHNHMRTSVQHRVGMWQTTFTDKLQPIANAYAKAAVYEPKAAIAFMDLAHDCTHRASVLGKQIQIEITDDPEPYPDAQKMSEDIHKRRRLTVSRANIMHPLWSMDQIVAFRICHDILGLAVSGGDFTWQGANLAFAAWAPLLSAHAQKALFTEVIAQAAYKAFYHGFGPQKVVLFPEFMDRAQRAENDGKEHPGTHPSDSAAPVPMPGIKHPLARVAGQILTDPNAGWESGVQPMSPNARVDHGDPLQANAVMDNAKLIDTEWAYLKTGDGQPDYQRMKLAIENAFRVVLLSPRKDLRWNAIHYQHIAHVPPGTTDPAVYWNTLEHHRQEWNVARFGEGARLDHMAYGKFLKPFQSILYQQNPGAGFKAAQAKADEVMSEWREQEERLVMKADEGKSEDKQMSSDEVDRKVNKALAIRMKTYIKNSQTSMDVTSAAMPTLFNPPEPEPVVKPNKYGAFMGGHCKSLAQVSQNIDQILKAALEDTHEHDATGHHFRAVVLQMGITGIGPKVCSFAWLLLQPVRSQLATIDTHMMDVLGHNFEKDMSHRDYFKFERELQTGRDASGYGDVPLGAFQWGMWDYKRTGEGSHQDHSAMKVLDPTSHENVPWADKVGPQGSAVLKGADWAKQGPDWWQATQPARDNVSQQWYDQLAGPDGNVPAQNKVPYNVSDEMDRTAASKSLKHWWDERKPLEEDAGIIGEYAAGCRLSKSEVKEFLSQHQADIPGDHEAFKQAVLDTYERFHVGKVASQALTPWFTHPQTGEHVQGSPGQPLMHHLVTSLGWSTPQIWEGVPEVGKA